MNFKCKHQLTRKKFWHSRTEEKKETNNDISNCINLFLNICITYFAGLLILTVVHINSNPISNDLLIKSMEDGHTEIHKAARDYILNNNAIRLETTRILCSTASDQFNGPLFDKADHKACDYFKKEAPVFAKKTFEKLVLNRATTANTKKEKNNDIKDLLNLDEVQNSAYKDNRSEILVSIPILMDLFVILFAVRCLFRLAKDFDK